MTSSQDPYKICQEADRFSLTSCLHRQSCLGSGRCAKIAKKAPSTMFNRPCRARRRSLPDCPAKVAVAEAVRARRSSASEVSDSLAYEVPTTPELEHKSAFLPVPPEAEEPERTLPTLSGEIISLILDNVLQISDLGDNARWSPNRQEAKERWIAAYRERAALHRKFSLIHRSWTPHVLKSLWRHVVLTSRFAIENLQDCLAHPEQLWAYGKPHIIPERRLLVQFVGFGVGGGRYSSTDYMMYSGKWINENSAVLFEKLPRYVGWEAEGWCSKSCHEAPDLLERVTDPDWPSGRCTRVSMIRSPVHLDALDATLGSSPNMETLELIDVGTYLSEQGLLPQLLAKYASKVRFLAVKLEFSPDGPGLLDKVFEACPALETLHIYHDLMTPAFFAQEIPSDLRVLLIGTSRGSPLVFRGRSALESLWDAARARWADETDTPADEADQASDTEVEETEHRRPMSAFERWLELEVRTGERKVESLDVEGSLQEASRLCVSGFQ